QCDSKSRGWVWRRDLNPQPPRPYSGGVTDRCMWKARFSSPRLLEQLEFGDVLSIAPEEVQQMLKLRSACTGHRYSATSLQYPRVRHRRGRGLARSRACRRVDRHLVEERAVVTFCVRLPHGLPDRRGTAGG